MRIGVKETFDKELVEISIHGTPGNLQAIKVQSIKRLIVINLDAIYPFQHQDMRRYILLIDARNVDRRVVLKRFPETLDIGGLALIIGLFKHCTPELAIETHQV